MACHSNESGTTGSRGGGPHPARCNFSTTCDTQRNCLKSDFQTVHSKSPCAGDAAGLLHVMEVPRSLRRRMHSEAKALTGLLQREVQRLNWLAASAAPGAPTKVRSFSAHFLVLFFAVVLLVQHPHVSCALLPLDQ